MKSRSVIFSNARIKALETRLLSSMQISRLAEAASFDEALKILSEFGYGAGATLEDSSKYEKLFTAEDNASVAVLRELAVEGSGVCAFLTRLDYLNAKALCKADVMHVEDCAFMLSPEGNLSYDFLKEEISCGEYRGVPAPMAAAFSKIDALRLDDKLTPRMIDVCLDKAMYEDIHGLLAKTKEKILVDYFARCADLQNLFASFRTLRAGLDEKFFSESFLPGGRLDEETFGIAFAQSKDALLEKLRYTEYAAVAARAAEGDLVKAETLADDMLLSDFRAQRGDMFSIAPIAGLYLAKQTEIKVVKLVMACVKNNVDKVALRQRMRELYA